MPNKICINQENFTRTKKKLKTALENQGISISLSQAATALAQSFGFKSENEMQNLYFKDLYNEKKLSLIELLEKNEKGYLIKHEVKEKIDFIEITYRSVQKPFLKYDQIVKDLMLNYIDQNEKGHVMITGATGSGKSTLLNKIMGKHKNLISMESFEHEKYFKNDEVRDIVGIEILNKYSNLNIIFSLHAVSIDTSIKRFENLTNNYKSEVSNNIKYVIHVNRLH